MNKKVIITNFTDPACTWCWGSEPILKKLLTHFGDQIEIRYVMGGLCEDYHSFIDPSNHIGGVAADVLNKQVAEHWEDASRRHGMPVRSEGYHLMSDEYPSTYPQNIAYKAAQQVAPDKADKFLRRLREATASEAQVTSRIDVQTNLADEVGIETAAFLKAIKDGSAEKAFKADLALTRSLGITGFPTWLIEYGDKRFLMHGYRSYDDFVQVIETASDGEVKPTNPVATEESIFAFIKEYGNIAPIEVQEAFDLTKSQEEEIINSLIHQGKIQKRIAGNGYFYSVKPSGNPLSCDPKTGICG